MSEEIISKELLSEVLGKGCTHINLVGEKDLNYNIGSYINIYELAFRTRDYFKTKSKHLSLNQSIEDIFKEANSIYESLSMWVTKEENLGERHGNK